MLTIKQYITCTFRQVIISIFFFINVFYLPFYCRSYLQAFFYNLHVINRLPFSISVLFIGSLFRLPCYLEAPFFNLRVNYRVPFSIYALFTVSLIRFPCYLQAPFFDLHFIYRPPFSISMLFTGSLFRFPCYLQAPFFYDFHVIYRLSFSTYALFTGSLFQFTCYLQPFYSIHRNNLHLIYMISSLCSENLQCFCHYLHVSLEIFTCFLHGISETCKRGKIM